MRAGAPCSLWRHAATTRVRCVAHGVRAGRRRPALRRRRRTAPLARPLPAAADIGGISPGSMPPHSHSLEEEGASIISHKLVQVGGRLQGRRGGARQEGRPLGWRDRAAATSLTPAVHSLPPPRAPSPRAASLTKRGSQTCCWRPAAAATRASAAPATCKTTCLISRRRWGGGAALCMTTHAC